MQLKKGEAEFNSGQASIEEFNIGEKDAKNLLKSSEGTLYLTNNRLAMEETVPSGEPAVIFEIPIGPAIRNINTKGLLSKRLTFEVDLSKMSTGEEKKKEELERGFANFSIKIEDAKGWAEQLSSSVAG